MRKPGTSGRPGSIIAVEPLPARGRSISAGQRPKVLLLIKCLGYGGAEQLLVDMMANRDAEAFDYEVAYVLAAENGLVPAVEASGVPVHNLGARGNGDPRWLPALRRLLVERKYDLVHLHLPYAAALGRLVARSLPRRDRPLIMYTDHNMWDKTALALRWLNRAGIGSDASLIAVSKSVGDALPAALRPRATVVVHGVDQARVAELQARRTDVRAAVRAELGVPDGALLALTVANLRTQKGYDVLLQAARRVLDAGVPVRFAAVGRGPQHDEVHALHASLELGPRFQLLGPRGDVLRLMAGADLFVLASHYEGLPVAIMEATSMGLAMVTTAVGEIPNFLTDGEDALIVPAGDPLALAGAIERVVTDDALRRRLETGALEHRSMFDIARAVTDVEAIYTRLLSGAA
jgi:glycosyltransferase involved in cell wall biosynthesis